MSVVAPSPRDRQARLATFAIFFVQGLCFAVLLTQVAAIQKKHALSDGELTIVLLVVPLIAGVGSWLAGALAARHGSRPVLRAAQAGVCLSVIAVGLAPGLPALYAATSAFGLAVGAVDASMNMQAVGVERRYGRAVITGFHAVWSVAAIIGSLWNSQAAALGLTLTPTFAIAAGAGVVISLAAGHLLLSRPEERTPETTENATPGARVPWRPILPLCLVMAFLYVGDAAISNFGTVYMDKILAASPAVLPLAYAAYQVAMLAARVPGDLAVRRFGPAPVVRLAGAVATLGLAGIVFAPSAPVAIAAFALTGLGLAVIAPQTFSAAGRQDPTGTAVARVNIFNYVGFIVGAAAVGVIADSSTYRLAFAAPLALAAAIILLAPAFTLRPRTPAPQPTHP
ncbi:MFS transporter [Bailinhaonella thermotolerans]|uniref:MFS transporter n=1 Tax=Bailinhaonella thermotolerans TaxID=1070861 RepID=A0A3A4B777_9ACTN|nr:MFS transporter [Bailinhaonella thermotolerans]RJL33354.1 MFS transporter [Bailinhaonella thermotolerans]